MVFSNWNSIQLKFLKPLHIKKMATILVFQCYFISAQNNYIPLVYDNTPDDSGKSRI